MITTKAIAIILVFAVSCLGQQRIPSPNTPCEFLAASPDFSIIAATARPPTLKAWDLKTSRRLWTSFAGRLGPLTSLAFHSSEQVIVTGSWGDGLGVNIWNAETGEHVRSLQVEDVRAMDLHSESDRIAISTEASRLYIASLDGSEPVLLESKEIKWDVAFSPDGKLLATASGERIKIWDLASASVIKTLPTRPGSRPWFNRSVQLWKEVWQVRFSPDGTKLVSGTDGYIQVWDVASWRELAFTKSGGSPESLTMSEDGKNVAWTNRKGEMLLWSGGRRGPRRILPKGSVWRAVFSPNFGRVVYSKGGKLFQLNLVTGNTKSAISCDDGDASTEAKYE